jgi:acyl carrier protein
MSQHSQQEIRQWMVNHLAELLERSPQEIKTDIPFDRYGLDSLAAVGMTGDLEDWLGEKLDPTLLYDYPTIDSFTAHLTEARQSFPNNHY